MKSSLFENMEWLDHEATNFAQRGKAGTKALAARAKKLSELAGALPWVGQAFTKARSLYFSLIQNQIVCIDDLDRKSKNLELKDVLGLISFLREQRRCKVALLLNAEQHGDQKKEFEDLLEKVIETKVVLAPTAAECATIAVPAEDSSSVAFRTHCETLGIRNIRVIKQIERLVRRIDELLIEFLSRSGIRLAILSRYSVGRSTTARKRQIWHSSKSVRLSGIWPKESSRYQRRRQLGKACSRNTSLDVRMTSI